MWITEKNEFKLIEPLKDFFKDEEDIWAKQFIQKIYVLDTLPGPGLGIRIVGNITSEKVKILQQALIIYISMN